MILDVIDPKFLGGTSPTNGNSVTKRMCEVLWEPKNFGGTETSASDGGDRKRDRPSSSRDHQAASMTVEACKEDDDDEDDEVSSSSEGESK